MAEQSSIVKNYKSSGFKKGGDSISELEKYLATEVQEAYDVRSPLKERWDLNEKVSRNDPDEAGVQLYENFDPRATPVLSPRIKRIVNITVSTITSPSPMVQAIPDDKDQVGADALEEALQTTWSRAGFKRIFRRALNTAALCGVSVVRLHMTEGGLKFDHVHPNDFVISPAHGLDIRDAHLVGHRFYIPKWKIRDRIKSGYYDLIDEDQLKGMSVSDPDEDPSGRDPSYDLARNSASGENFNDLVELYELIVRIDVDGKSTRKRVVFNLDDHKLFLIEDYQYSRPWYFDIRLHDEEGKWWPSGSIAQDIIGLCLLQGDMFNLLVAGSMATAVSPAVVSGGSLGQKEIGMNLGQLIETPYDVKVQTIPNNFNPGAMPGLMDVISNQIEAQTGITDQRLSAERTSGDVTATQIAAEEQAAQQNEGSYPDFASDFIESIAAFWQELVRKHSSIFRSAYGEAINEAVYGFARNAVRWAVTGRNPGNSPHFLIGKLQSLAAMAMQPGSTLSYPKVEKAIVNAMQLPINVESIMKDADELAQEQAQIALMAQLQAAGQGGNAGNGGINGAVPPTAGMEIPS